MDPEEIKKNMQDRKGLHPSELTSELLRKAGCMPVVMALPEDFMERVSYIGNLLAQMTMHNQGVKNDRLRLVVSQMTQAVSYVLNSTSWESGELHDFDYSEIQNKLGRFVRAPESGRFVITLTDDQFEKLSDRSQHLTETLASRYENIDLIIQRQG